MDLPAAGIDGAHNRMSENTFAEIRQVRRANVLLKSGDPSFGAYIKQAAWMERVPLLPTSFRWLVCVGLLQRNVVSPFYLGIASFGFADEPLVSKNSEERFNVLLWEAQSQGFFHAS